MAIYNNFGYPQYGYQQQQQPFYSQPMQDNLAQLRNQQQYQMQQMPQNKIIDDRIWVQGEVGAKAYLVAPGNTVPLWDSENSVIWLKSVDLAGIPSMQKLTYSLPEKPSDVAHKQNFGDYITREEFEKRIKELLDKKEMKENVQQSDAADTAV